MLYCAGITISRLRSTNRMHIADGILPAGVCLAACGVSLAATYALGRRLEPAEVTRMGLMATATFVVSLIHFPFAGTTVHLGLFGLLGVLLGRRAMPVVFTVLLFQAMLFQHGGLLSLGINSFNMGVGVLVAWGLWSVPGVPRPVRAFGAGFAGVLAPALLMAGEFAAVHYGAGAAAIAAIYLGVAALEGLITVTTVGFLHRVRPEALLPVKV